MEFDWVMGGGLGWFVGPKFVLCDCLVGLGQSFAGLGWVGLKKLDPRTTLIGLCLTSTPTDLALKHETHCDFAL